MSEYERRSYGVKISDGLDEITVSKLPNSHWADIALSVNGNTSRITLRSQEMVEQLHFALSQMLRKG
ncbi:MAG: hypothetical protein ACRDAM_02280 [Casimicrobium sp.]